MAREQTNEPAPVEATAKAERTRAMRQKAGTFRPSYIWECEVCDPVKYTYQPEVDAYFCEPPIVLAHELKRIGDMYYRPDRESFYFKHSPEQVPAIAKEHLWPPLEEDQIFRWIYVNATSTVEGVVKDKAAIERTVWNVIDRGYA